MNNVGVSITDTFMFSYRLNLVIETDSGVGVSRERVKKRFNFLLTIFRILWHNHSNGTYLT